MNIYEQISSNKRNSYFLIFFFCFIIIALGYLIGRIFLGNYLIGIIFAFIIAIIFSLIGFYSGDKMILSMSHAKEVSKQDDPFLINTVEGLSIAAGLKKPPNVYMIEENSINAFATGRNPENSSITITSGARKKLNRLELEGVISHELSHVKNYDIRFMMLVVILLGIVVLLSDAILRGFLWGGGRKDSKGSGAGGAIIILIGLALAILAPIIAQLIKFAISRKREYLADSDGALLTRYPKGLADALRKIKKDTDKVVDTANKATAHLYIENPLRNKENVNWIDRLFMTHPSIDERIKILDSM